MPSATPLFGATRHTARHTLSMGPLTPHLFAPSPQRPLRAKLHRLQVADLQPHSHPWAQLAWSNRGVIRLTMPHGSYIVPPSRALWVPPGIEHAVTVLEDAELRTLYLRQPRGRCGPGAMRADEPAWRQCRVLQVSDLLRALILELDLRADDDPVPLDAVQLQRERRLAALILDELRRAPPVHLGVALPADKRLRSLCEAVIEDPTRHATLDGWARDCGASPRTLARLFRQELDTTFLSWRQQVLLARAVAMAARKIPVGRIAAELGYASASAFTAMVRRSMGAPPSRFFV